MSYTISGPLTLGTQSRSTNVDGNVSLIRNGCNSTNSLIYSDGSKLVGLGTPSQGDILYFGASGVPQLLNAGTAGYVLFSDGPSSNPYWDFLSTSFTGPESSVVNTIPVWNVTTGNELKSTGISIDGSNNITGVASLSCEDLTVNGTSTTLNVNSVETEENIIMLSRSNVANTIDPGFVQKYIQSSNTYYQGFVKDVSASRWKPFSGLTSNPGTTIDFGIASLDDIECANLYGNVRSATQSYITSLPNLTSLNGISITSDPSLSGLYSVSTTYLTATYTSAFTTTGNILVNLGNTYDIGASGTTFANGYFSNLYGAVRTASQPNITTLGGVTSLNSITVGSGTLSGLSSVSTSGFTLTTGAGTNKYLISDSSGVASWATLSSNAVTSITGTSNQVIASASTGSITLSLPQSIATSSNVQFNKLGIGTSSPNCGLDVRVADSSTYTATYATFGSSSADNGANISIFNQAPGIGFNVAVNSGSGFVYGPGSLSNYGAAINFVPSTGILTFWTSSGTGNAGGSTSLVSALTLDSSQLLTTKAITASGNILPGTNNTYNLGAASTGLWSNVYATNVYGTLQTASQPNITTLAGVTSIGASGSTTITGTLQTAAQTNITSVGTLSSLTSSGSITGSGFLASSAGSASSPAFSFSSDSNTGIYNSNTDEISFATGGSQQAIISNSGMTLNKVLTMSGSISNNELINITGTVSRANANGYGMTFSPTLTLSTGTRNQIGMYILPTYNKTGGTVTSAFSLYIDAVGGTASPTNAYGIYAKNPAYGTNMTACYLDDLAVGYTGTSPPSNGAIILGNVGIGKSTASTALDVNGTVTATSFSGTITTASQPNITTLGGVTSLNSITVGSGTLSDLSSISATSITGTLQTASQPNITTLGGVTSLNSITVGTNTLSDVKYLAFSGTSSSDRIIDVSGTVTGSSANCYGVGITPTLSLSSGTQNLYGCIVGGTHNKSGGTVSNSFGLYVDGQNGTAAATSSYALYALRPLMGTSRTAAYLQDCCVGTTGVTPPTNGLVVAGNTGIGISSPAVRLDVSATGGTLSGTSSSSATLRVYAGQLGSSSTNELQVASFGGVDNNNTSLGISLYRTASSPTDYTTSQIVLSKNVDSTVRSGAYISIGQSNVGINTLSPSYSLDVSGTTQTGALKVGSGSANPSAIVDISSTTLGMLPPKMTTTQRNAISSPATGLIVYDTTTNATTAYDGAVWVPVGLTRKVGRWVESSAATSSGAMTLPSSVFGYYTVLIHGTTTSSGRLNLIINSDTTPGNYNSTMSGVGNSTSSFFATSAGPNVSAFCQLWVSSTSSTIKVSFCTNTASTGNLTFGAGFYTGSTLNTLNWAMNSGTGTFTGEIDVFFTQYN